MSHQPHRPHPPTRFAGDHELEDLVKGFESCRLEGGFNHQRHIAVACWYLLHGTPDQALTRMRAGLYRLLSHQGHGDEQIAAVYHETITSFWIKLLAHLLDNDDPSLPAYRRVNAILEAWGTKDPLFSHYTRETVMSDEARQGWVEPDKHPMPPAPMKTRSAFTD